MISSWVSVPQRLVENGNAKGTPVLRQEVSICPTVVRMLSQRACKDSRTGVGKDKGKEH